MAQEIKMPDLGTAVTEILLLRWLKKEGDKITRGEPLCEVETDKATTDLESVASGVVLRHLAAEGDKIETGSVIAIIGEPGEVIATHTRISEVTTRDTACDNDNIAAKEKTGEHVGRQKYKRNFLLKMYADMVRIRHFEDRVKFLFLEGVMPGTIHQCQGQEATAVGVCAALNQDDVITSTHRPHGHCLAKGLGVNEMMAELFGKVTGCCKGKGGSMHMGDLAKGVVPAIAIVGGNLPLAAGAALAFKMRGEKRVAVSFMGDGATNEGIFHETLNMAALWNLPVIFVVENNIYGASTNVKLTVRTENISERAAIYKIPGVTVDGNDPIMVYEAAKTAVERARSGQGPSLLELITYRITGHSRRDPCLYQPESERKQALESEPIKRFKTYLLTNQIASESDLQQIDKEIDDEIECAVAAAKAAPEPAPEDALDDVFVENI